MNSKQVLQRARELCGEDRHERVLRTSYRAKHHKDIKPEVLERHISSLKDRGRVPDYLHAMIEHEAAATKDRQRSARQATRSAQTYQRDPGDRGAVAEFVGQGGGL